MAEARMQLNPGMRMRDTYTVDRYLDSGRFADVYLVRHRYLGMQAMKVLVAAFDEEAGQEAFREAFVLSRITHPGIVRVFDANRADFDGCSCSYITMEFVSGGTLADLIAASPFGLRTSAALDIALQVARAVAIAHTLNRPIVHRDIKPTNILFDKEGNQLRARVADFGLAKAVDRFTDCVSAAGTLLYTAPESLRGFETPASDVFSLGLVLYELLTGVLPFRRSSLHACTSDSEVRALLAQLHHQPMNVPSENDPALGPDVDFLIGSMLTPSLAHRCHDASELVEILEACLDSRAASSEEWDDGPGRKPAEIGFRIARDRGRRDEAVQWLLKAGLIQPTLKPRLRPFVSLFTQGAGSGRSQETKSYNDD